MEKKRIIKLISFAIFILLIFQLIPSTVNCVDGSQSHTQNSKVFLSSGSIHTDVLYVGRESQKTAIQKVQVKNIPTFVSQISNADISAIQFTSQEMPFDHRRVIRQSIPHYFNGGKYKKIHFAI